MCLLLIVDDDDFVRDSVAAILASLGHEIIHARDGLEALKIYIAKYSAIHLIIMDIMMPVMNGIAATKAIKDIYPSAKIILMSGYSDQGCPVEADAFLAKPFRSKTLIETVEQVLDSAGYLNF
jgi:CheY-like chemotaxis protein